MRRLLVSLAAIFVFVGPVSAYTVTRETALTSDGVTLVMKRYKKVGGTPVILCHGIVQNDACMDLPVAGSSFAKYLADRGYDVWVVNLRSHGKGIYQSGSSGQWDWAIDEFAAYDVPAMVNRVRALTGKNPFWVGHSMGGMAAYGYLQGVKLQNVKVDEVWGWQWCGFYPCYRKLYDVYGKRVVRDSYLASQRNAMLRGLVTLGSPVKLKWRYDVSIFDYWLHSYWDYNLVVNGLADSNAANSALESMAYVPAGTLSAYLSGDIRNIPYVGGPLASFLQWVFGSVGTSVLTAQVWNPQNMTPTISQAVINDTLDNTESRVAQQFLDGVRNQTWREYHVSDPFHDPYVYADHYDSIKLPLLLVAGNRDKMCNDNIAYWEGFRVMGSTDRTWRDFDAFGHDDLVLGVRADDEVYPFVESWLRAR